MVSCFFCPRTLKGDDKVANPHFEIKITKRSKRQSAVAGAAYQSGENLFSEYDQKHKDYRKKEGVVYTEIMLPSHAPPEYADRTEQLRKQVEAQLQDGKKTYHLVVTFDTAAFNALSTEAGE